MKVFAALILFLSLLAAQQQKRVFWAFRTPVKADVPALGNPIDAFILAKLREKGLELAPKGDHRALIRRLHFDLAGLPPAPADLQKSYEENVELLLASPAYGERWGRHWLDVVRFGETDGGEHNYERFHAWPYRDYVIEAFQKDKPYNEFIREQIAGDLLRPNDPRMVAATGFLVAGPWDQVSAELNKDKNMALQARMDELDDMVTTTFHTFQALTVNCARCHDHKFDPIPTRDYYRLTDVFQTVGFGTRTVASQDELEAWKQKTQPFRDRLKRYESALADIEQPVRAKLLHTKYQDFDRSREGATQRLPINPIWNRNFFAPSGGKRFRFVITGHKGNAPKLERFMIRGANSVEWGEWTGNRKATTENPYIIELPFSGRFWEITWSCDRTRGLNDGAITVYRFEASDDGFKWRTVASSLDHVGANELDLPVVETTELLANLTPEQKAQRSRLLDEIAKIKDELKAIPEPPKVYSAIPKTPAQSYILERGSVSKRKEEVAAGALSAVAQLPTDLPRDNARLALADWITNPQNPLTARVIINRVWYYHFGRGLVNTPSDFGLSGDRPSHPELLDWLAVSFMENGWSIKWLHRLILSSQTYQQSSQHNEKAFAVDADNRLLWHMPLRRMDAETLRDTMLAATGNLDLQRRGGPSYLLQKKGDAGSYIYQALDNDGPEVWRRSVYRFVVRGGERIMMDSFDCPDPSVATPQRSLSNTPVQALTLMNNSFVLRQASLLAKRAMAESPQDPALRAYQLLFQREPTSRERELAARFLTDQPFELYCRVLLNSNEFLYVP